ncbi:putative transcriptional repressor [Kockovaella imperatae]|uniref:Putative transcriptional repressor n=1 Tax=Kockovaella imperatae TaxID=4999 RepID=A0A1Y1UI31_9TREE|nr:putative transcriptional repressor [Kockovaella imperatae]ORX37723.1 putative transcriptional repressor [Kockovaella imperatae]
MNFFGRTKARGPADSIKSLREHVARLDQTSSADSKRRINEEISRLLSSTKQALAGEGDADAGGDVLAQVANEVYASDILNLMVVNLGKFEFEARKDSCHIFNTLLRRQIGSRLPTVEYITNRPDIVLNTLKCYSNPDIALNSGMILKEMLRYEPLAKILLYSDDFYTFPQYIENSTFGISCDAFANMKETLTKHKPMVATYLDANYDKFFAMYTNLILSANYVTKRQSLKLLGEILLDRANYNIMTRYISAESNLKMMMNFLRDKSRNIQFEAFHVFKVFVANPNKPPQIASILRRNKDKLLIFLKEFHNDKDDEQFNDEKQFLIAQIQQM